ncbi:hypothetical protein OQA88_7325 [Cercophora sp. LCS_1]
MSGRSRGRGGALRRPTEPAAGAPGRRSTRNQPQQQLQSEDVSDAQIDPRITASQDSDMPPPPLPTPRLRTGDIARRGAPPGRDSSVSIVSQRPSSSVEPTSQYFYEESPRAARGRSLVRSSMAFEGPPDSPGMKVATTRLMRKRLVHLEGACRDFVTHYFTSDSDPAAWEIEYTFIRDVFHGQREPYVAYRGGTLIDIPSVSQNWGVNAPQARRVLFMSNLASLFEDIRRTELTKDDVRSVLDLLQSLESEFPRFYIETNDQGNYILSNDDLFQLVLEIRTQVFIFTLLLHKQENAKPEGAMVDPLEKARTVFFSDEATLEEVSRLVMYEEIPHTFKPVEGIQSDLYHVHAMNRVFRLCKDLPKQESPSVDLELESLQELFSFDNFLDSLKNNAKTAWSLLDKQPPDSWAQTPTPSQAYGSRVAAALSPSAQLAEEANTQDNSQPQDGFAALIEVFHHNQDALNDAHNAQSAPFPPVSNVSYPQGLSYGGASSQSNGNMYAQSAAQAAEKRKRGAEEGEAGPAKKQRGRRKQPPVVPPREPTSSVPPVASQYPAPPSSAVEPDFEALAQRSREISAANRKAREPQQRSAWTRNDIRTLVKAVDIYKCKWSLIEKEINKGELPFEVPRDQQALRDKARLLKQDFLKTDTLLPPSFDLVVLGKKEKNAVIVVGKNPDRKESDVNSDGMAVNTEYHSEANALLQAVASDTVSHVPEANMQPSNNVDAESEIAA